MITEQEIDAAIAECVGKRNPDANTVRTLAALYTIKEHLYPAEPVGNSERLERAENALSNYSFAPAPDQKPYAISLDSDTDFARVIEGREPEEIMPLMDEAMSLLASVYPACYDAIMRKLQ